MLKQLQVKKATLRDLALGRLFYAIDHPVDLDTVEKLKESIMDRGILQPIIVEPDSGHYRIIDGVHRFKAAVDLGHTSMEGYILE